MPSYHDSFGSGRFAIEIFTFPGGLTRKNIRRIGYLSSSSRSFANENLRFAWQAGRWGLVIALTYVTVRGKLLAIFFASTVVYASENI